MFSAAFDYPYSLFLKFPAISTDEYSERAECTKRHEPNGFKSDFYKNAAHWRKIN